MKVTFSSTHSAWSVKAPSGTLVSLTGTPSQAADGIYTIGDEGYILIDDQMLTDSIYLSISGSDYEVAAGARIAYPAEGVEVRAGSSVLPFKSGGKGGGGGSGGGCTYRGTTTTAISNGSTTNPITIDGESYTAVFGDVVVYGYTEFVFDGTAWSEFGRPFDTVPTSGSINAVTSDGVYRNTAGMREFVNNTLKGEIFNVYSGSNKNVASGTASHAEGDSTKATAPTSHAEGESTTASGTRAHVEGYYTTASGITSHAEGERTTASGTGSHAEGGRATASGTCSHAGGLDTIANKTASTAIGKYNVADTDVTHLFIVGNGTSTNARSNILEVSETDVNVNGDIKENGVSLPTPYTTMPAITSNMLGQVAQYVGTTGADFTKGYFYIASSDGAAEPTYSWVNLPTSPRTYSETVLFSANSPHTNNITLSEPYTNFDDIVIVWKYSSPVPGTVDNYSVRYTKTYKVSTFGDGVDFLCNEETSAQDFTAYTLGDTTHINYDSKVGTYYNWIAKVIGIKY